MMLLVAATLMWPVAHPACAQLSSGQPKALDGVGVEPKLGDMIDPSISFQDDEHNFVHIGDYFDGKRPIILSFNYSDCPAQCSVQLEKMTLALRQIDFEVGKNFQVISVSIDPNEQTSRAREAKAKYSKLYNRPGSENGWHFLTGENKQIQALAAQCGIKYKFIPHQKLYSHPPVFLLISPQGKVVRYVEGFDYISSTIKLALVESAEGKIGSPLVFMTYVAGCFVYDEATGKYTMAAMGIMRMGGAITVVALVLGLVPYWLFHRKKPANEPSSSNESVLGDALKRENKSQATATH
jgi:protein SCO1/2